MYGKGFPDRSYVVNGKRKWHLGVCAGTKGSGAWLREWIELQMLSGIDHLWIVNDNSNETRDGTAGILSYYERIGFATILPGPMPKTYRGCEVRTSKNWMHNCIAPKYCAHHVGDQADWLIFADTDEFIYPHTGCDLSDFVKNTCDPMQSHVSIRWERFGTNGFAYHPSGLMTENFLESGGNCAHINTGRYKGLKMCANQPFNYCIECRHMKVMFNTKNCLDEHHFGMVHWPVNTSLWKKSKDSDAWVKSPGPGSDFKNESCKLMPWSDDVAMCAKWLKKGGGSSDPVKYTSNCCAAGIGYNHYGTKSMQYYARKARRSKVDLRGLRVDIDVIDLGGVISYSVLRFVRALRSRYISLGLPVSANSYFLDFPKGTAYMETNFKYTSITHMGTTTIESSSATTAAECAELCFISSDLGCEAFTYEHDTETCTFIVPPLYATVQSMSLGRKQWPRTHIPARRTWDFGFVSGVMIRDSECPLRS
eukprot:TRINITY_DN1977_c1_g2_i1.p1 TRINITY_DN1977_c1_g2~~TRINITY_DN1977_c1_g2_i1.p1  ORF type:complete len:561 (+),score=47.87 TRINITY_DN1977_c1_g2_i1:246-1685(+)